MIPQKKIFIILCAIAFFFPAFSLHAAKLSLESPTPSRIPREELFRVDIIADTEGDSINAFEGTVQFPASLTLKEIRTEGSLITFWIDEPALTKNPLHWSGIVPGGFSGRGTIFSLVFVGESASAATINLTGVRALLSDGAGTERVVKVSGYPYTITSEVSSDPERRVKAIIDPEPPEAFEASVTHDPSIFEDASFIVFNTQDKGSGIDHYEIMESRGEVANPALATSWVRVESPFVLTDQKLKSYIYVKAVDKKGNERIVVYPPKRDFTTFYFLGWCILVLIVLYALRRMTRRGRH